MVRGDIVIVNLPQPTGSSGHEQTGDRPALIVHEDATRPTLPVVMIIPFTSNMNAQRFPNTILVQPSPQNGLSIPSVLLVFQLRAIDNQRILKTIGHLEPQTMELVNDQLRRLLSL